MQSRLAALLGTVCLAALAGACSRSLANRDAQQANADADGLTIDADSSELPSDASQNNGGQDATTDAAACYPLFHACMSSDQCCAPNLCLTINGGPACQVEGPAPKRFTSWTSCGWSSGGACLCDGIRACEAVAGGAFSALGSQQARVCAMDGDVCEYVVFVETEGGGTARRCRVPINAPSCVTGFGNTPDSHCVDLFTCNLSMGTCPPDVMPGGPVISCR